MNALTEKLDIEKQRLNIKTDAEFAELIGIKPSAYSRLKSGERANKGTGTKDS